MELPVAAAALKIALSGCHRWPATILMNSTKTLDSGGDCEEGLEERLGLEIGGWGLGVEQRDGHAINEIMTLN